MERQLLGLGLSLRWLTEGSLADMTCKLEHMTESCCLERNLVGWNSEMQKKSRTGCQWHISQVGMEM